MVESPPHFSSHRSTDALLRVFSGSGVARYREDGIAFSGHTRNKVPSSRTTPFPDLHSGRARIHEKTPDKIDRRAPGKPTGVTVEPHNTGADARRTLSISWTANPNGNKAITNHEIQWSPDGTAGSWNPLRTVAGGLTETLFTGLSPGTTRHIRIRSQDSDGWGPWSDVVSGTTNAVSRPGPIPSRTAMVTGPSTIDLSWTAPDDGGSAIKKYVIVVGKAGGTKPLITIDDIDPTTRSYTVTGLLASTKYTISVQPSNAIGSDGSFKLVQPTTSAATRPGPPATLNAQVTGPSTITVTWLPPEETGGSPITGYRVRVFVGEDFSTETFVDVEPTVRSYTVTGLLASTKYTISVQPKNRIGSNGSFKLVQPTTAAPTRPGRPTGLNATAVGRDKIKLSWTAPTDNGGKPITGYRIDFQPDRGWPTLVDNTGTTATEYTHTGLAPSTTHTYLVRARNGSGPGGVGGFSNQATATTKAATRPSAPRGLTATPSDRSTIILNWMPPADDGGSPITFYRVDVSTDQGSSWGALTDVRGATTYSHTGLSAGTRRDYRVVAANSSGRGFSDLSNVATATTAAATRPGAPTNVAAVAEGQTVINLSWEAPADNGGAAITGYQIFISETGSPPWALPFQNYKSTSYKHTGLSAGAARYYQVRARNSVGLGPFSKTVNATTAAAPSLSAPAAPTGLRAEAEGPETISLSWNAPTNTGGAAITGYQIEVSPTGAVNTWTDLVANTGSTTTGYVHRGLDAGTTRHYRARALNSVGAASNVVSATTTALTATAPGAPTGLTATASGQTTINLSWTAPSNTGGAAITGYRVEVSPNGTDNWTDLVANSTTTYAHTGLSAGVTRHYRVRAINAVGTGAASNVATATTTALTAPGAPTGLTATAAGRTIINLSWTAPTESGGAAITGYRVEVSPTGTGDTWADLVANSTTTTYAHTGLSANTTRYYRVRALNAVGASDASNTANATTDGITAPSAPTGLTATTYSHTGLPPETTRQYRVRAINAVGTGAASNVVRATTEAATVLSLAGAISSQRYPVDLAIAALLLPTAIGGTPPYMYALSPETLPEGLSLEDGTLGGTPTAVTASQGFTWTVTDALGAESTIEFTLEIYEITFVTTVMNQSYDRGQGIDPLILPEVTGGTDPVQYTLNLLSLPSGLRFDASTRTIAGTPVQITSPVELTYRATDAKGAQASLTFTLEVVSPVATEEQKEPPQELIVHANYPNPFHTSTNLLFDLPWPAEIKLDVLDLTGRRVYTHPMVRMAAGREQVITLEQVALPAGVYLYRMVATSMEHGASAVKVGHLMRMR